MFIEVCDQCQTQWYLIDMPEKRVLCHTCFRKKYGEDEWSLKFEGSLSGFDKLVRTLNAVGDQQQEPQA